MAGIYTIGFGLIRFGGGGIGLMGFAFDWLFFFGVVVWIGFGGVWTEGRRIDLY